MTKVTHQEVNLLGLVELMHRHLTEALFSRVHTDVRNKERQRQWTLKYLVQFWTAVVLRAPVSLTQALNDARGLVTDKVRDTFYPPVESTNEAFFEKCRNLKWQFFHAIYEGFTESILPEAPKNYGSALKHIFERFPDVFVIDGSKCDAIRHRLKLLWKEKSVVLPGAVTAVYDLAHGITRHLVFSADAASHELPRALDVLAGLPKGALVLGDRLYALPKFFRALSENGLWG
ncbi:MAG TPA: transposase, partial [Nitrosomonas sp.]|nr:transposase [Nitrosomonas sp.]